MEKKKWTLVPTKNTHSWSLPQSQPKTLITDLKTLWGVRFIDIVPVIEVQGLIVPTKMGQENKIDTIPEENLRTGGHWHNPSPKLWWLVTPKGLDSATINQSWSSINFWTYQAFLVSSDFILFSYQAGGTGIGFLKLVSACGVSKILFWLVWSKSISTGAQYVTLENKIKCLSIAFFFFWQPHQ
jgi:hypothetical protein